jgi:pimeloyl-ACP methyl ester carboxylesterase
MPRADLQGVGIHYERFGVGPDVVMVHGLAANLAFWALAIAPRLARSARVTVYDLRGHGYSDMPRRGYAPADMACDLDHLLDHLGIDDAHVVGHSFGGAVALEHALMHSDRVRSLMLADPVLPMLASREPAVAELRRWIGELERADERSRPLDGDGFAPFSRWNGAERSAARWKRLLRETDAPRELVASRAPLEALADLDVPVLVMCGARSRYRPLASQLARLLPNCRTVTVPGVGHFHPALRPSEFAGAVSEFVGHER